MKQMNDASLWRYEVAQYVAPIIARNPKVKAVIVGGSVSRGNADSYSDIEIGVFWSEPPTDTERLAPIEPSGGVFWELDPYDPVEQTWMDGWGMGGVKMDVRNLTLEGFEQYLSDVLENADTTDFKHMAISAVQHSIPLYNPTLIEQWQARITVYPPALARAMVEEHLHLDAWCWWVELLAKRGDLPLFYSSLSAAAKDLLVILMGLNGIYHPGFKWMQRLIGEMTIAPTGLAERIENPFRAEPLQARAIFRDLMLETYDLIDAHMPEVETQEAREAFLKHRKQIHAMPDSLRLRDK